MASEVTTGRAGLSPCKNIVICSDGTGNTVNKGRGTNVFKLFEALDLSGHLDDPSLVPQQAFYDDGVGTAQLAPLRILGGAMGWGLARNVRQLYRELSRADEPGDRIFMFGFSRGAFTVRTLAGLIGDCGLVDLDNPRPARVLGLLSPGSSLWLRWVAWRAWRSHRWHYRALLEKVLLSPFRRDPGQVTRGFRQKYSRDRGDDDKLPRLHFIGVWDTVGAVAIPFNALRVFLDNIVYRFSFPNKDLPDRVEKTCPAIAIDEERHAFHPVLWDEVPPATVGQCQCGFASPSGDGEPERRSAERAAEPRAEQVWFPGVHSNIGGGYAKQGISLVTLDWMMAKAEQHGLRFNRLARQQVHGQRNVHDFLYDSRRGPALYYFYLPRNIGRLITKRAHDPKRQDYPDGWGGEQRYRLKKLIVDQQTRVALRVHASVFDRIRAGTGEYAPGSIPASLSIVETPGEARGNLEMLRERIAAEPQARQTGWMAVRMVAQVSLYSITAAAILIASGGPEGLWSLARFIWDHSSEPLSLVRLAWEASPWTVAAVVGALGLAWAASRTARGRIQSAQASYWNRILGRTLEPTDSDIHTERISPDGAG